MISNVDENKIIKYEFHSIFDNKYNINYVNISKKDFYSYN